MPIALPPAPLRNNVILPPQPQDPPTALDLAEAHFYAENIYELFPRDRNTDRAIEAASAYKDAVDYERNIYHAIGGGIGAIPAPDLLHELMAGLEQTIRTEVGQARTEFQQTIMAQVGPLRGDVRQLVADNTQLRHNMFRMQIEVTDRLDGLARSIEAVKEHVINVDQNTARALNTTRRDGTTRPFQSVIFADGTHPTGNHHLPRLRTATDILNLSNDDLRTYVRLHGGDGAQERPLLIEFLKEAIGGLF